MKKAALICSFLLLSIIAVLAVSCGGGGGGVSAATGGNNAGKRGFGNGSGEVKVYVNGKLAGSSSGSSRSSGGSEEMPENASTASYSEGIMALGWNTMDFKLWVNGQLYFNQTLNKGDKFSIAGLKLGDSVRAEGNFYTSDGTPYLITGGIPSVQNGSKLSMYVTYKWTCKTTGLPTNVYVPGTTSGTYTAETGAALPAIQCLDGRTVVGWLNATSGLSTDGKVWKSIPAGTTGNLDFEIVEAKSLGGEAIFSVSGKNITGFISGKEQSVIKIPEGVTSIAANAFKDNTTITSVSLPSTLQSLGSRAFYQCTGITSISIPANVTTIGDSAFYKCSNLSSVNFVGNSQLTSLNLWTFAFTNISSIEIPEGVTSIPGSCFQSCPLTRVSLPSTLTSINSQAFCNCTNLTSITIPANVTSINAKAFSNCATAYYMVRFTITMQGANPPTLGGTDVFSGISNMTVRVKAADKPRYESVSSWNTFSYETY